MDNYITIHKSCHSLDKHRLFSKSWSETVVLKIVKDEEVINIVGTLKNKTTKIFHYVETNT